MKDNRVSEVRKRRNNYTCINILDIIFFEMRRTKKKEDRKKNKNKERGGFSIQHRYSTDCIFGRILRLICLQTCLIQRI